MAVSAKVCVRFIGWWLVQPSTDLCQFLTQLLQSKRKKDICKTRLLAGEKAWPRLLRYFSQSWCWALCRISLSRLSCSLKFASVFYILLQGCLLRSPSCYVAARFKEERRERYLSFSFAPLPFCWISRRRPQKKYKTTAKYKQDNVHPPAIICMRPATKSWRNALNLPLELPTRSWCYALNLLLELPAGPWCYALNLLLELPVTNVTRIWQIVPCHWRRLGLVFGEFLCHRLNLKTLPSHGQRCCPCPPQDGSLFWAFFLFFWNFTLQGLFWAFPLYWRSFTWSAMNKQSQTWCLN